MLALTALICKYINHHQKNVYETNCKLLLSLIKKSTKVIFSRVNREHANIPTGMMWKIYTINIWESIGNSKHLHLSPLVYLLVMIQKLYKQLLQHCGRNRVRGVTERGKITCNILQTPLRTLISTTAYFCSVCLNKQHLFHHIIFLFIPYLHVQFEIHSIGTCAVERHAFNCYSQM